MIYSSLQQKHDEMKRWDTYDNGNEGEFKDEIFN